MMTKNKRGLECLQNADIYGITAEEHSLGRSTIDVVMQMIESGITVIQYREKEKSDRQQYEECRKIREMTRDAGVTFIVNDRVDLALLVDADGLHLGQDDAPPEAVRKLVGDTMFIGLSTHSPAQADDAVRSGVDYIGVGPLFATNTKKDVCNPVGLEYLEYVVKNIRLPFVAIGGIKEHNIAEVYRRGARCIALVTDIVGAPDINAKVRSLRAAMGGGVTLTFFLFLPSPRRGLHPPMNQN
jgi:thiamine-phosphate pyrophosphorylase